MNHSTKPMMKAGLTFKLLDNQEVVAYDGTSKKSVVLNAVSYQLLLHCDGLKSRADLLALLTEKGVDASAASLDSHLVRLESLHLLVRPVMPKKSPQLHVENLGDEAIVYDRKHDTAHACTADSLKILSHCDGKTPVAEAGRALWPALEESESTDLTWLALEQLQGKGLVKYAGIPSQSSRRSLLKAALLTVALPVVASVFAPQPSSAASNCQLGCAPTFTAAQLCGPAGSECTPCKRTAPGVLDCATFNCFITTSVAFGSTTCQGDVAVNGSSPLCLAAAITPNCVTARAATGGAVDAVYSCCCNCT